MFRRIRVNMLAVLTSAVILTSAGCGIVVIAGLGALGGYAISPDTVEGILGYSEAELFRSASDTLSIMGMVTEQSKGTGHVAATIAGVRVTVDVLPTSKSTTKLRVKARRWAFPKMSVAQEVYVKIVRKLQE
ncbi:MAG: hypothetical protein JNN05_11840 [Candidatus Omnitrophica bacterium]|nr:hypothetical protein [Candidatus Omnitrophota bacterium]